MITLNIFGRELSLNPIEFVSDGIVANGAAVESGFTGCVNPAGSMFSLQEVLRPYYNECRAANLPYTSARFTIIEAEWTFWDNDETHKTGSVDIQYSYDPAYPNLLYFKVYNGLIGNVQFGYDIDFTDPDSSHYNVCVTQTTFKNYSQPTEGAIVLNVFCPVDWYRESGTDYMGGWIKKEYPGNTPWDPSQLQWVHKSLAYSVINGLECSVDPDIWTGFNQRYNTLFNGCYIPCSGGKTIYLDDEEYVPSSSDATDTSETPDSLYNPDSSDPFPDDGLPSNSVLDTGFIKAYYVTSANLQSLATFMMTDSFIQNVKKLYANPIDYIVSVHLIPVVPSYGSAQNIGIGGVNTMCSGHPITDAYVSVDMGTINVAEMYGSFLDYENATKCTLYLPFIGFVDISTNDIMGGSVNVLYKINVITGDAVCVVTCKNNKYLDGVCYTYNCNMIEQVPITMSDFSNRYQSAINSAAALVGVGVGLYASSPAAVAMGLTSLIGSSIETATAHPAIKRSGSLSGGSGILSPYTPALIKERPVKQVPKAFNDLVGKVSNVSGTVGSFTGFNIFNNVKLGTSATDAEKDQILQLLESGVFL